MHEIVILETDWSDDGTARAVNEPHVGPDFTYRDVFGGAAAMLDARVDYAQFASEEGFTVLLRRFVSRRDAPFLVVGGHGSRVRLHPPAGPFNVYDVLQEHISARHEKKGLILAGCDLGQSRERIRSLLSEGCFEWVAAYRSEVHAVSAPFIELTFWRALFDGWLWSKRGGPGKHRVAKAGNPIAAGLFTKLEIASAVASRFDVRVVHNGELVSSLEIFSAIADKLDIHEGGLSSVKVHTGSDQVGEYEGIFKRVWAYQWEREVE